MICVQLLDREPAPAQIREHEQLEQLDGRVAPLGVAAGVGAMRRNRRAPAARSRPTAAAAGPSGPSARPPRASCTFASIAWCHRGFRARTSSSLTRAASSASSALLLPHLPSPTAAAAGLPTATATVDCDAPMIRALRLLQRGKRRGVVALPSSGPGVAHSPSNRCGPTASSAGSIRPDSIASATSCAVTGASSTPLRK